MTAVLRCCARLNFVATAVGNCEFGAGPLGHRKRVLEAAGSLGAPPAPVPLSMPSGEAERRQLSVMFCDLVGSVELGERMDVEDYRDLLARFRDAVVGAVG